MMANPVLAQLHEAHLARRRRMMAIPSPPISRVLPALVAGSAPRAAIGLSWRDDPQADSHLQCYLEYMLGIFVPPIRLGTPAIAIIIGVSAEYFGVAAVDIIGPWRSKTVVRARHVAMYVAYHLCRRSTPEIGRRFGNKDHTTVLNALRRIEALKALPEYAEAIGAVEREAKLEILRRSLIDRAP